MFDDILPPHKEDADITEYDEHGFYKDNTLKNESMRDHNIDTCDCDDCVEAAIKKIATKMKLALEDKDVEIIKKEYFDRVNSSNVNISIEYMICQNYRRNKT